MICIYCLIDKSSNCFTKTEHVLSQSFGRFEKNLTLKIKNHPTLSEVVCNECNQWFGNNIENHLARDTLEGMARFKHGIKQDSEYASPGKKSRIKINLDEGALKGSHTYLDYSSIENKVILKLVPQAGFKNISDGDSYTYFPIDEIPPGEYIKRNFDLSSAKSIVITGSPLEYEAVICALNEREITFERGGIFETNKQIDHQCKVEFKIDSTIQRAIAKIAFNYLAYVSGPEFVRNDYFNSIRKFIRYGEVGKYTVAQALEEPILGDESLAGKRRLGHIVTLGYDKSNEIIFSQVSLFNDITYLVPLSNTFKERDFYYRSGHFFSTGNRKIIELYCSPRS